MKKLNFVAGALALVSLFTSCTKYDKEAAKLAHQVPAGAPSNSADDGTNQADVLSDSKLNSGFNGTFQSTPTFIPPVMGPGGKTDTPINADSNASQTNDGNSGRDVDLSGTKVEPKDIKESNSYAKFTYEKVKSPELVQAGQSTFKAGTVDYSVFTFHSEEWGDRTLIQPTVFLSIDNLEAQKNKYSTEADDADVSLQVQFQIVEGIKTVSVSPYGGMTYSNKDVTLPAELSQRRLITELQCPKEIQIISDSKIIASKFMMKSTVCPLYMPLSGTVLIKKERLKALTSRLVAGQAYNINSIFDLNLPKKVKTVDVKLNEDETINLLRNASNQTSPKSMNYLSRAATSFRAAQEILKSTSANTEENSIRLAKTLSDQYFILSEKDSDCLDDPCFKIAKNELAGVIHLSIDELDDHPTNFQSSSPLEVEVVEKVQSNIRMAGVSLFDVPTDQKIVELSNLKLGDLIVVNVDRFAYGHINIEPTAVARNPNLVCLDSGTQCIDGKWTCTNPNSEQYNCQDVCTKKETVCVKYEQRCDAWEPGDCCRGSACVMSGNDVAMAKDPGGDQTMCPRVCSHTSNVCVQSEERCVAMGKQCSTRTVCSRLSSPPRPSLPYWNGRVNPTAANFQWTCTNVTGPRCLPDRTQDQWTQTETYGKPQATGLVNSRPLTDSNADSIFSGIDMRFSNGKRCSMSSLPYNRLNVNQWAVRLRPNSVCPFVESESASLGNMTVSLYETKVEKAEFKCGEKWSNFKGDIRRSCVIPGYYNTSSDSNESTDHAIRANGGRPDIMKDYYVPLQIDLEVKHVSSTLRTILK